VSYLISLLATTQKDQYQFELVYNILKITENCQLTNIELDLFLTRLCENEMLLSALQVIYEIPNEVNSGAGLAVDHLLSWNQKMKVAATNIILRLSTSSYERLDEHLILRKKQLSSAFLNYLDCVFRSFIAICEQK